MSTHKENNTCGADVGPEQPEIRRPSTKARHTGKARKSANNMPGTTPWHVHAPCIPRRILDQWKARAPRWPRYKCPGHPRRAHQAQDQYPAMGLLSVRVARLFRRRRMSWTWKQRGKARLRKPPACGIMYWNSKYKRVRKYIKREWQRRVPFTRPRHRRMKSAKGLNAQRKRAVHAVITPAMCDEDRGPTS